MQYKWKILLFAMRGRSGIGNGRNWGQFVIYSVKLTIQTLASWLGHAKLQGFYSKTKIFEYTL